MQDYMLTYHPGILMGVVVARVSDRASSRMPVASFAL